MLLRSDRGKIRSYDERLGLAGKIVGRHRVGLLLGRGRRRATNTLGASNQERTAAAGGFAWAHQNTVLFTTVERANLWKQSIRGGAPEKVTSFSDVWIARYALSPDGILLLSRGTALRDAVLISNFQ